MPRIRIYKFSPKSQPPSQIHNMFNWFNTEVSTASIEPVDSYEISNNDLINGSDKHLSIATRLYKGLMLLKKEFERLKQRW